jgi:uncharacterized repeat protein (TIGR01451 family)
MHKQLVSRVLTMAAVAASMTMVVPTAGAAPLGRGAPVVPAALGDNGPFAASALASLVTLDVAALSPSVLPQTDLDLAPSEAGADSDVDFDDGRAGAQRSFAVGGVTYGSTLLEAPLDAQSNEATAPESEVNEATLLPVDAAPLLDLPVISSRAEANYLSDVECVAPGTPLSVADQTAADVTLVSPEDGQSLVALNTADGEGAADTQVATYLAAIDGPGDARAVQARATTQISSANLLNGLAGEGSAFEVDVVQAPTYLVQATGLPGGASVTGDRPVVNVQADGESLATLDDDNPTEDATVTDLTLGDVFDVEGDGALTGEGGLLEDLGLGDLGDQVGDQEGEVQSALGDLQPIVRFSIPYTEVEAPDGTHASVEGSILRIEVLPPEALGATEPFALIVNQILEALVGDVSAALMEVDLGPISASADAPAGGIDCTAAVDDNPLRELNKHASAAEVAPGGTFDYSITVPNRGPCTVTDVVVVDEITGPGFTVVDTEPAADVDGGTVTFAVGDLAPNETVELTITVQVDEGAPDGATFDDLVTATGECDGEPVTEDEPLEDTPTVRDDFTGPCSVRFSNKDASHAQVTPGETFTYYVHAFNSGAEACTDVAVTDTLDDRVSFVSCNRGCAADGQTVRWTVDEIPGGSSVALAVVVLVDDDATGTLANVAEIAPENGPAVTVRSNGPVVSDQSVPQDPISPIRLPSLSGLPRTDGLPRTGGAIPTAAAATLGLGALALLALRRRTTA